MSEKLQEATMKALQKPYLNERRNKKIEANKKKAKENSLKDELDWDVEEPDEDDKDMYKAIYHAEKGGYYFNIYEETDGTFNLIVDFKDYELQDLDDYFDTLEDAKKRCEEIYREDNSDYDDYDEDEDW